MLQLHLIIDMYVTDLKRERETETNRQKLKLKDRNFKHKIHMIQQKTPDVTNQRTLKRFNQPGFRAMQEPLKVPLNSPPRISINIPHNWHYKMCRDDDFID